LKVRGGAEKKRMQGGNADPYPEGTDAGGTDAGGQMQGDVEIREGAFLFCNEI
jgi:hypothetical protein